MTANKERPEEESSGRPATSLLMFCVFRVDAVTANNQNNNSSTALLMEWRNNSTTETELDSFMTGVLQLDCLIQCFQFIKMFSVNQLVTIRRISTGFLFCLKILLTHAGDWFSSCRLLFSFSPCCYTAHNVTIELYVAQFLFQLDNQCG